MRTIKYRYAYFKISFPENHLNIQARAKIKGPKNT